MTKGGSSQKEKAAQRVVVEFVSAMRVCVQGKTVTKTGRQKGRTDEGYWREGY